MLVLFNRLVEEVNKDVFDPQFLVVNREPKISNLRLKLVFILLLILIQERVHSLKLGSQDGKHLIARMIVPYDFRLLNATRGEQFEEFLALWVVFLVNKV
jgi:hypothetical protein